MKKLLSTKWGLLFLILLILLVFISFAKFKIFSTSEGVLGYSVNPIQSLLSDSASRISNFFKYFGDIEKIKKENNQLNEKVAELTSINLKLENDLENIGVIKKEYDYINNYNYNSVIAKIVSHGSDNYLQSVIINKGEKDGIKIGYPAVSNSGFIVGKIIETNNYTSKILLLNDIHSKLGVNINNEFHSPGVLIGEFGLSLKLNLIPYNHEISVGDIVVTSGLEKNIPADLIVGKVSNIIKNEGELFQSVDVDQIINYENIRILTIILPIDD